MLREKQLQDIVHCTGCLTCGECAQGITCEQLAQTALEYRVILKRLEWVKDTGKVGGAIYKFCPICGTVQNQGHNHSPDCEFAKLLEEAEK